MSEQSRPPISKEAREMFAALPAKPDPFMADEYAAIAREALGCLWEMRKQIIHGGAWTKRVDAVTARAKAAGL